MGHHLVAGENGCFFGWIPEDYGDFIGFDPSPSKPGLLKCSEFTPLVLQVMVFWYQTDIHHEKVWPFISSFKDVPHGKSWPSLDNVYTVLRIFQKSCTKGMVFFNLLFFLNNGIHHLSTQQVQEFCYKQQYVDIWSIYLFKQIQGWHYAITFVEQ